MKLKSTHFIGAIACGVVAIAILFAAYRGVVDMRQTIKTLITQQDEIRAAEEEKRRKELSERTLKMQYPADILNAIQNNEER